MAIEFTCQIYEAINTEQISKMLNICADLSKRISASLSSVFAETNYLTDLSESLAQLTNALSPIIKK